jgi:hypothetical protein
MRKRSANSSGFGFNGSEVQATTRENLFIGFDHPLVIVLHIRIIRVEGIGIFHEEFTRAHNAEPRANLIAELDLDLVENLRQLAIGVDLGRRQRGDDLLVGRAEQPFLLGAIPHLEEHVRSGLVATALLPNLGRLQGGHKHLEGTGAVHLLAHNLFDLAERAEAQGKKGVDAAGHLAQQARAEQEFVRKNLRVRGSFLQGRNQCLGPAHEDGSVVRC